MFEAPVLAAGAFHRACKTLNVDPAKFTAKWSKGEEERQLGWEDVFDVDEQEAAEAAEAIKKDVYLAHEQHAA